MNNNLIPIIILFILLSIPKISVCKFNNTVSMYYKSSYLFIESNGIPKHKINGFINKGIQKKN